MVKPWRFNSLALITIGLMIHHETALEVKQGRVQTTSLESLELALLFPVERAHGS